MNFLILVEVMHKSRQHATNTAHALLLQAIYMSQADINSIGHSLGRSILQIHALQHLLLLGRQSIHGLGHLLLQQLALRHFYWGC